MSRREVLKEMMKDRRKADQNRAAEEAPQAEPKQTSEKRVKAKEEPRQPGELTEAEARKCLMDKAMKEGDQKALMAIPLEDSDTFYQRWLRYVEEEEDANRGRAIASGRAGPSSETRKKLREKRKKRR